MEQNLTGKLFKILPIFEDNEENCRKYVSSLVVDLMQEELNEEEQKVLKKIKGLRELFNAGETVQHDEIKSIVFRCIRIIQTKEE